MSAPDGFAAFGHDVPSYRKSNALAALRQMAPDCTLNQAMDMIDRVSAAIAHDDPYRALFEATGAPSPVAVSSPDFGSVLVKTTHLTLDVTGGYRLLATLCTGDPE